MTQTSGPNESDKIVRVGISVAIKVATGFVFLKRIGSHGAGEWSFPGGHIDFGETILECAAREIREEVGLVLQNAFVIPVITEDRFPEKQYVTLYVMGTADGEPRIMEPHRATDMMVVPIDGDLPTPLFSGVEEVWKAMCQENRAHDSQDVWEAL